MDALRAVIRKRDPQAARLPHAGLSPVALALGRDMREDGGEMRYLSRAVNHEGEALESFAAKTWDKAAALWVMKGDEAVWQA